MVKSFVDVGTFKLFYLWKFRTSMEGHSHCKLELSFGLPMHPAVHKHCWQCNKISSPFRNPKRPKNNSSPGGRSQSSPLPVQIGRIVHEVFVAVPKNPSLCNATKVSGECKIQWVLGRTGLFQQQSRVICLNQVWKLFATLSYYKACTARRVSEDFSPELQNHRSRKPQASRGVSGCDDNAWMHQGICSFCPPNAGGYGP